SDTTAVALAAALGADCEIYSDVDGVYSADPREVPEAVRLGELDYEAMQALARAGAKVLHAQAVQLAEERGIAIYARHVSPGVRGETVIRRNPAQRAGVDAIASDASITRLALELRPGLSHAALASLSAELGALGLRYLRVDGDGASGLLSRSQRTDAGAARDRFAAITRGLGRSLKAAFAIEDLALVSCIGAGIEERAELPATAITALEEAGVQIRQVFTDTRALAFVVASSERLAAVQALHRRLIGARAHPSG
ncbi:MAG: aspartate kinase, partial [Myxococcales bacterium]|nr:aspartate kinase [Myxococcales bacterium]